MEKESKPSSELASMMNSNEQNNESMAQDIRMQMVLPKLFIGDLTSAQSLPILQRHNIRNVVSVMKQSYPQHPGFNYLSVPVDDTLKTNICEWFDIVANWVQARLDDSDSYGVLIHCMAGISRSATLLAAYLMKAHKLTADEAVGYISSKRPQIEPNEFFLHQLEMYERCNCEWNPVQYQEQRRFMMNFMADEMKDGAEPEKLILAYYPSPAPSPKDGTMSMTMTALKTASVEDKLNSPSVLSPTNGSFNNSPIVPIEPPPARRRFTKRTEPNPSNLDGLRKYEPSSEKQLTVETLGRGQVIVKGRRLRCKMCRRELAATEHVLVHSPGKGQSAFAPQRQDMSKFRQRAIMAHGGTETENSPAKHRSSEGVAGKLRISMPPHLKIVPPPPPPPISPIEVTTPGDTNNLNSSTQLRELSINSSSSTPLIKSENCSSYFVEPLSWMKFFLEKGESMGKVLCPNHHCRSKLGSFDWAGSQCSCGAWITPGFQILRSKVDEL